MLKRILAFALFLVMAALVVPVTANAADIKWQFDNTTGILIGKAPGQIPSFPSLGVKDKKKILEVYLEDGVTSIGRATFGECTELLYVRIPSSVKSLGVSAFNFCQSMGAVDLPEGLTEIPAYCFYYCLMLGDLRIPSGVTSIQQEAFYRNRSMTRVFIPASVTQIHSTAFNGCDNLTICCPAGAYAETFADEQGFRCVAMTEEEAKTQFPPSGYTIDLNRTGTDVDVPDVSTEPAATSAFEQKLSEGLPPWVFFAAGGAVVVIAALVVVIVLQGKKKRNKTEE